MKLFLIFCTRLTGICCPRSETHSFILPAGEVIVTLEDVLHIFSLSIDGEVVTSWTDSSQYFLANQSMTIFGSEPVAWERMPFLAPIPRQRFAFADILVARRTWMSRSAVSIRHDIDYIEEFVWQSYLSIIIPVKLHHYLDVCGTVGPLLSFECVEWHLVDRVVCQYGAMIGAPYSTNGFSNGRTAATVSCEIGISNQSLTLARLHPIIHPNSHPSNHMQCSSHVLMIAHNYLSHHSTTITARITAIIASTTASTTACLTASIAVWDTSLQTFPHCHHRAITAVAVVILGIGGWFGLSKPRTPTPDSRASDCINSHLEIDTGHLNVLTEAPSSLDLNAPTQQEVFDEYIPSPFTPAETGGSETVQGQTVGHQYNLQTDVPPPNRFTPSSVNRIANKSMQLFAVS
ncbi:uncharacterized protein DS421_14g468940 [Arachis hypogaea]|nr:uncharacterized protein DS421_14g468940 [Arachis hypogaea]